MLIDSVIIPILLYDAEVWGEYLYDCESNSIVQLIQSHCWFTDILQVHKRTNKYDVRFELGLLPLLLNNVCTSSSYFISLCNRNVNSMAVVALKLHICKQSPWFKFTKCFILNLGFNKREHVWKQRLC